MKYSFLFLSFLTLSAGIFCPSGLAGEVEDRYLRLRQEELLAKEKRLDEMRNEIEVLRQQTEEERKLVREASEKLWKEFVQGLEVKRKDLSQEVENLNDRQRLFELELEKKRKQDELRIQEKQNEMERKMLELDRLHSELQEDRKVLNEKIDEWNKQRSRQASAPAEGSGSPDEETSEVLSNGATRISGMTGREIIGDRPFPTKQVRPSYYIEIGDVLDIDVWRVADLSRSVTVRPDGKISLPLVGDLDIVDKTLTEVRDMISRKLSEYVINPQVSLSLRQFGGRKFIILGEVNSPGVYRYQYDISLLEAIALAGGFSKEAKRGQIMVVRGDIHKQPQVKIISANMNNVLKRGMISENLSVLPNDIIYVGRSYIGDYNDVISDFIEPALNSVIDFFVLRSAIRTAQKRTA